MTCVRCSLIYFGVLWHDSYARLPTWKKMNGRWFTFYFFIWYFLLLYLSVEGTLQKIPPMYQDYHKWHDSCHSSNYTCRGSRCSQQGTQRMCAEADPPPVDRFPMKYWAIFLLPVELYTPKNIYIHHRHHHHQINFILHASAFFPLFSPLSLGAIKFFCEEGKNMRFFLANSTFIFLFVWWCFGVPSEAENTVQMKCCNFCVVTLKISKIKVIWKRFLFTRKSRLESDTKECVIRTNGFINSRYVFCVPQGARLQKKVIREWSDDDNDKAWEREDLLVPHRFEHCLPVGFKVHNELELSSTIFLLNMNNFFVGHGAKKVLQDPVSLAI